MFILVTGPTRSGKSEWAEEVTLRLFQQLLNQKNNPQNHPESNPQNELPIPVQPVMRQSLNAPPINPPTIELPLPTIELIYIATASHNPDDPEWTARIKAHQQRRLSPWQTLEVPEHLCQALNELTADQVVLVDALGTWLANLLDRDDQQWQILETALINAVVNCRATLVCVAEEVGWSVVPAYTSGRLFRDRLGRLVRQLAGVADHTYLVVAGFALDLRQMGTRVPDAFAK